MEEYNPGSNTWNLDRNTLRILVRFWRRRGRLQSHVRHVEETPNRQMNGSAKVNSQPCWAARLVNQREAEFLIYYHTMKCRMSKLMYQCHRGD